MEVFRGRRSERAPPTEERREGAAPAAAVRLASVSVSGRERGRAQKVADGGGGCGGAADGRGGGMRSAAPMADRTTVRRWMDVGG